MNKTKIKLAFSIIGGLSVVILYCTSTLVSYLFWPKTEEFSPATSWLTWLGMYSKNTVIGVNFYNSGCMLSGIAFIPFFLGLSIFYSQAKWKTILIIIAQIIGIFDGIALFFVGFYSDPIILHIIWSGIFFRINLLAFIMISVFLLFSEKYIKIISICGFSFAFFSLVQAFVFPGSTVLEWFTVFDSIGYVGLIVLNIYLKFGREDGK